MAAASESTTCTSGWEHAWNPHIGGDDGGTQTPAGGPEAPVESQLPESHHVARPDRDLPRRRQQREGDWQIVRTSGLR